MIAVGRLYRGGHLDRLLPFEGPAPVEVRTLRVLPAQEPYWVAPGVPAARPTVTEVWRQVGHEADGELTADFWLRTFTRWLPADLDRRTGTIPIRWVWYSLV